jgi:hypothetical protein
MLKLKRQAKITLSKKSSSSSMRGNKYQLFFDLFMMQLRFETFAPAAAQPSNKNLEMELHY